MKNVKIGLIGLGFMGSTHFGIYRKLPGVQIVALADVDPEKLTGDISKVVGNIGDNDVSKPLDMTGIRTYSDAMQVIADPEVDIVDICVPTPDHTKLIVAALRAGKHVFSEKPLCRNRKEMEEINAAFQESGKYYNVGMCIRAWPEYRHAYEMYQSGAFGKVRSANFRRLSPSVDGNAWRNWFMKNEWSGGALLDLHLHDTDAVRYFFGRPAAVSSFGVKGVVSDCGIDHLVTNYDYQDGSLIVAEGGWAANKQVPFEMSFQLICEKATVRFAGEGYKIYWNDGRVEAPQVGDPALPTGWHQELAYFTSCVRDKVTPDRYQNWQEIMDSFCMIVAEEQSVNEGKKVTVQYV